MVTKMTSYFSFLASKSQQRTNHPSSTTGLSRLLPSQVRDGRLGDGVEGHGQLPPAPVHQELRRRVEESKGVRKFIQFFFKC